MKKSWLVALMLLSLLSVTAQNEQFPEQLERYDLTKPLMEVDQLHGGYWQVEDTIVRNAIPIEKRVQGMIVSWQVSGNWTTNRFDGVDTTNTEWIKWSNWNRLALDGDYLSSFGDTTVYNYSFGNIDGDTATFTGLNVLGSYTSTVKSIDGSDWAMLEVDGSDIAIVSYVGSTSSFIDMGASGMFIADNQNTKGLEYIGDYSANYTDRSIVDKGYVDGVHPLDSNITRTDHLVSSNLYISTGTGAIDNYLINSKNIRLFNGGANNTISNSVNIEVSNGADYNYIGFSDTAVFNNNSSYNNVINSDNIRITNSSPYNYVAFSDSIEITETTSKCIVIGGENSLIQNGTVRSRILFGHGDTIISNLSGTTSYGVTLIASDSTRINRGVNSVFINMNDTLLIDIEDATYLGENVYMPNIPLSTGKDTILVYDDGAISKQLSADAWVLSGNSGTTAATDFIGTSDDVDLIIKRNSIEQIRFYDDSLALTQQSISATARSINIGSGNIVSPFGVDGYTNTVIGKTNTISGNSIFVNGTDNNITGGWVTAIGRNLIQTSGSDGILIGSQNVSNNQTGYIIGSGCRTDYASQWLFGIGLRGNENNQFIVGEYNDTTISDVSFMVGTGSSNINRGSAFYIKDDSTIVMTGESINLPNIPLSTGKDTILVYDNGAISKQASSDSLFLARNYVNASGIDITISVDGDYYTVKPMLIDTAINMTTTDSSFTAASSGWYHFSYGSSGYADGASESVHSSLFINDVENTAFEGENFHRNVSETYNIIIPGGDIYLSLGDVVKVKTKYDGDTGTYHISHAGLSIHKLQ